MWTVRAQNTYQALSPEPLLQFLQIEPHLLQEIEPHFSHFLQS